MNVQRWRFANDYNTPGAVYANCHLDTTVNISQYQHPSITPGFTVTSTTVYTGDQLFGGSGGATKSSGLGYTTLKWADLIPVAYTIQAGDTIQFTTTAQLVTILLTGITGAGMGFTSGQTGGAGVVVANELHNGALAQVFVDGVLQLMLDCYQATPQGQLFLDGLSHVIKIVHSGQYNVAISPVSSVTNTVGTSVGTGWSPNITILANPTFLAAKWRILATGAGTFNLLRTLPGGSETTVDTGLTTGTLYTGSGSGATGGAAAPHIPGISFKVTGTLTNGDTAFLITDSTMVGVQSVTLQSGTGVAAGAYTSAVVDSGEPDTQWFLAEWIDNQPMAQFQLATSQTIHYSGVHSSHSPGVPTLTQDTTYAVTTFTPQDMALQVAAVNSGDVGLVNAPRSRYCQWTITFPAITTTQPWFRDLWLFYWVPERDPNFIGKIALGKDWVMGPNLNGILGALATHRAVTDTLTSDFAASYTISSAVDQYAAGYGADFGLPQYSGEQIQTYQARLAGVINSRNASGTLPHIAGDIALLVNGAASPITPPVAGVTPAVASSGGVIVAQTNSQQFNVTIPPYPYTGLPGLTPAQAQVIIKAFILGTQTPVNSVINPNNNPATINITFL